MAHPLDNVDSWSSLPHVAFDRLKYRFSGAIAVEPDRRARVRDSHDFGVDGRRPRPYHAAIL